MFHYSHFLINFIVFLFKVSKKKKKLEKYLDKMTTCDMIMQMNFLIKHYNYNFEI